MAPDFYGNDLELDGAHVATHNESVVHLDRAVRLGEVRLEPNLKKVAGNAFDGVGERKDGDLGAVRDIVDLVDTDDVAKLHSQVLADAAVDPDLALLA